MDITFVIQARVGSSRLPRKILLPFYRDLTMLDLLVEKLRQVKNTGILIATSDSPQDDEIEKIAHLNGIFCFRGSENDVLQRFVDAAYLVGTQHVIRICSDNPFLELDSIQTLVDLVRILPSTVDYVGFSINGIPSIKTHYGFWTEYVSLSALEKVLKHTSEQLYHEHVTNFIYAHPEKFDIKWINGPDVLEDHKDIRLTIDTKKDFENAQCIYNDLINKTPYPTILDIVEYLDKDKNLYSSMKSEILKNLK